VLDNYAYLVHQVGRRTELDLLVAEWLKSYTLLVKVPLWQKPRFDGVRATDISFQEEIDREVDRLTAELEPPCLRLVPKDRDVWIVRVLKALQLPLEPPQVDLFPEDIPADADPDGD
jgi:hypothetical protein